MTMPRQQEASRAGNLQALLGLFGNDLAPAACLGTAVAGLAVTVSDRFSDCLLFRLKTCRDQR
jgi:hypothetical protein